MVGNLCNGLRQSSGESKSGSPSRSPTTRPPGAQPRRTSRRMRQRHPQRPRPPRRRRRVSCQSDTRRRTQPTSMLRPRRTFRHTHHRANDARRFGGPLSPHPTHGHTSTTPNSSALGEGRRGTQRTGRVRRAEQSSHGACHKHTHTHPECNKDRQQPLVSVMTDFVQQTGENTGRGP
jgi:hypothetical protein